MSIEDWKMGGSRVVVRIKILVSDYARKRISLEVPSEQMSSYEGIRQILVDTRIVNAKYQRLLCMEEDLDTAELLVTVKMKGKRVPLMSLTFS